MRSLMVRYLSILLGAAVLVGSLSVQAQQTTRIGFVNTERLFAEADAAVAAQSKLRKEFAGRERLLIQEGKALEQAIKQFKKQADTLSDTKRLETERQLMQRDAAFREKTRIFQLDLSNRKNEEMQGFVSKANTVVEQVAKKEKYDVVIQEAAYIHPRIDITDKVLKILNSKK